MVFIYDRNLGNHGESNESNVFSMFQLSFYIGMVEMMPPLKLALRKKKHGFDSDASRLLIWMQTRRHNYHSM